MIRIRPYKRCDQAALLSWLKEERTVALWKADRFSWPLTEAQLEAYGRDFSREADKAAFTALNEAGVPVGHFSFRRIDWEMGTAHLGFIVTDPAVRGTGCGRQMVRLALACAFDLLGLSRVTLGVYDCNQAARRCYEAEGFVPADRPGFETVFHGETWRYFYLQADRPGCKSGS